MDINNEEPRKRARSEFKSQGGTNFPAKLHFVLESVERDGQQDIIGWQPHGRAFMIRDIDRLVSQILPFFFRMSEKFASFQRQLNLYGFIRIYKGPDHGAYYHPSFLRDEPLLAHAMARVPVKGKQTKLLGNERPVPDFYQDYDTTCHAAPVPAATVQSSSSNTRISNIPSNIPPQSNTTLMTSLEASAMSRTMTHRDANAMTTLNVLANRYSSQPRIPWVAFPGYPPTLLSLYRPVIAPVEVQQTPIDAYLRELMLLSSIRQNYYRR